MNRLDTRKVRKVWIFSNDAYIP